MFGNNETGVDNAVLPGKKIDRDTAKNEFITYCENNRIEHDESAMNDEEIESFKDIEKNFIRACTDGRLEVDGTSLKYTISDFSKDGFKGEIIIIKRPSGQAYSATDGVKTVDNVKRVNCFLSAQTGKEVSYFSKIDILDWKFFNAIASLFLSI